ncbi:MAG: hypothetical protein Kow0077_26130 [Anaerolineae bacterium]
MTQRWGMALLGFAVGVMIMFFVGAALFAAARPTDRVLWQACQPDDVNYDDAQYCLSIIEGGLNLQFWPLATLRHTAVLVGRSGQASYGHYTDYTLHSTGDLSAAYLDALEVSWTAEGVTLAEPSGHRLFIPAQWFTGGR